MTLSIIRDDCDSRSATLEMVSRGEKTAKLVAVTTWDSCIKRPRQCRAFLWYVTIANYTRLG